MPDDKAQFSLNTADYDAIEAAVMETERGRWFLREFARRNRNADSTVILKALDHLNRLMKERAAQAPSSPADSSADQSRRVLREAAAGIRRAASQIQERREALDLPHEDGLPGPGTATLRPIDDVLHVLRGMEEKITALLASLDRIPGDVRAAEIARLKSEMLRDTEPSVPYLM
ncbi:hypothetical protein [Microvirga pudoricolor]|uniref:hypothetical protein n=1 Tax=Microvirga pudoricolor TaxID=2778729 RepID=UPI00194E3271|nr:hypothetical protein [Microvirga pudoricolor]MBM6594493.1 hypothetical protein [Microvirga pudoricolor]